MSISTAPRSEATLALILGASRWPNCPKFQDAPSLERSADAFIQFLRSEQGLGLPFRHIKSLFNSYDDPAEQLDQAHAFIMRQRDQADERGQPIRDLIIYYAGHGDFEGEGRDFYLTIRRAHKDHPLLTNITARSFGNWMRQTARDLRAYLIVDCCFAAALQHGFLSSPLGLAELRLNEALPDPAVFETGDDVPMAGVALLAAAGLNDPASAPPNEPYTRFTAALLEVLNEGHERFPTTLSLSDLHQLVDRRISRKFPDQARPELRSLQQTRGRVELVRLFRNPAAERIEEKRKAEETARLAEEQRNAAAEETTRLVEEQRNAAAEEAARLAEEQRKTEETATLAEKQPSADEAVLLAEVKHNTEEGARLTEIRRKEEEFRLFEAAARQKRGANEATEVPGEKRLTSEAARLGEERQTVEEEAARAEKKGKVDDGQLAGERHRARTAVSQLVAKFAKPDPHFIRGLLRKKAGFTISDVVGNTTVTDSEARAALSLLRNGGWLETVETPKNGLGKGQIGLQWTDAGRSSAFVGALAALAKKLARQAKAEQQPVRAGEENHQSEESRLADEHRKAQEVDREAEEHRKAEASAQAAELEWAAGRSEEALVATREAIRLLRSLAEARPEAFTPDLAGSLTTLAGRLSELGRREEALAAHRESFSLVRSLAEDKPEVFIPYLAVLCDSLTNCLGELGQKEEALAVTQEAVGVFRRIAQAGPNAYSVVLVNSLIVLTYRLSDLGHDAESLASAEEAVRLSRELAAASPDHFSPVLAASLDTLANQLSETGRKDDALAIVRETIRLIQGVKPEIFTPALALSFNGVAARLSELGQEKEALTATQEVIQLAWPVAGSEVFAAIQATLFSGLARRLSEPDQRKDAVAALQEATRRAQALATANNEEVAPFRAGFLSGLASRLAELGQREEALLVAQDTIRCSRDLTEAKFGHFLVGLFSSLARRFDPDVAMAATQEGMRLFRNLTDPEPRNAGSLLTELSVWLSNFDRVTGQEVDTETRRTGQNTATAFPPRVELASNFYRLLRWLHADFRGAEIHGSGEEVSRLAEAQRTAQQVTMAAEEQRPGEGALPPRSGIRPHYVVKAVVIAISIIAAPYVFILLFKWFAL